MSDSFQQRTAFGAVLLGGGMTLLVLVAAFNDGLGGGYLIALVPFVGFAALALWGRRTSRTWLSLASLAWLFGGLALTRLLF
ncbi:hypothetical protein [Streptomyces sp. AC550_RSS872]|uniref:hypothetical protein n=1 Tax=Streptomyces sp. AC550_RSS872 TaxID=2823689 RepID=UPI001C260FBA|nr:hypothetical protein [Streptomyces sp. AC550_RSS872]